MDTWTLNNIEQWAEEEETNRYFAPVHRVCGLQKQTVGVNQLKNGSWIVTWTWNETIRDHVYKSGRIVFNCPGHRSTFQAKYVLSITNPTPLLILNVKSWRSDEDGTANDDRFRFLTAFINGHMKEMNETSQRLWGPVEFKSPSELTFQRHGPFSITFQLIFEFVSSAGEPQMLTRLSNLLDSQLMSDVQFEVKGRHIGGHVAILALGSPVLAAMFEAGRFREDQTRTVRVDDIEPDVFHQMLRYLYTGRAPELERESMTMPLFLAADKYQIDDLKTACEDALRRQLKLDTVVNHLVTAHLVTAPTLLESALAFIAAHKKEMWTRPEWNNLVKSYPDLFYIASQRMVMDQ